MKWEKLGSTAQDQRSKNPNLKLWMNCLNLSFTVEDRIGNFHKTRLLKLKKHYLKFKNSSKNWEKYIFHWKELNFEHIANSVLPHYFGIRKYPEYLYRPFDVFPTQTTSEMKALQVQVYIQQ